MQAVGSLEELYLKREDRIRVHLDAMERLRKQVDSVYDKSPRGGNRDTERLALQEEGKALEDCLRVEREGMECVRLESCHFRCLQRIGSDKNAALSEVDVCIEGDGQILLSRVTLSSEPMIPPCPAGLVQGAVSIWPGGVHGTYEILVSYWKGPRGVDELQKISSLEMDRNVKGVLSAGKYRKCALLWRDGTRDELYCAHFEELEETLGAHMRRCKRRRVQRVEGITKLWALQRQAYDKGNEQHERMLLQLWEAAKQGEKLPDRVGPHWKTLGFQGNDPATDFRGMGLLGLHTLLFMAKHRLQDMQNILASNQDYPFAAAAINVCSLIFEKLNFKASTSLDQLYHSSAEFNTPLMDFFCRVEDENVFEEVFVVLLLLVDATYVKMKATYMQFPIVMKSVRSVFDELMALRVVSVDQLRFLVQQRILAQKML